mmetsp:Transcript_17730/g.37243  ORF Transcript_17730/g.37243 Transcript_17730/m.37243 type:complete len:113 (+) Transcript_17730:739-1077(+)
MSLRRVRGRVLTEETKSPAQQTRLRKVTPGEDEAGPGDVDLATFDPDLVEDGEGGERSGEESAKRVRQRGVDPGYKRGGDPQGSEDDFDKRGSTGTRSRSESRLETKLAASR